MRTVLRVVCLVVLLGFPGPAAAQQPLTLAWDASTDPSVVGYVLSWGTREGQYTSTVDVGNQTQWTLPALDPYQRYFFTVQSYDAARVMSDQTPWVSNDGLVVQTGGTLPDTHPGIFWRNSATGSLRTWHLSGAKVIDTRALSVESASDTDWKIVGTGDLNADGFTDLVWQNSGDGGLAAWYLQNNVVIYSGFLSIPVVGDRAWRLAGVGDIDGDRHADLVWHHTNGTVAAWFMRGTKVMRTTRLNVAPVTDTGWRIAAVGDINRDGRADLVWHHTNGSLAAWLLHGTTLAATRFLSVPAMTDTNWRLAAAGRIDAASGPTLVWQHATGGIAVWYVDGFTVLSSRYLDPGVVADTNWKIVGAR